MKTHNNPTARLRWRTACAANLLPLLLLTLPATGQAQFSFSTNDGTITIEGYTGPGGAVVIPDTINGLPVTSIGVYGFANQTNVTGVAIPNTVTSIGDFAFALCNLTSVTIPSSVTNIEFAIFYRCTRLSTITVDPLNSFYGSLDGVLFNKSQTLLIHYPEGKPGSSYTVPGSVAKIEDYAFRSCTRLSSVTIPDSVTRIGRLAFRDCTNITAATIGNGVSSIGEEAFRSCTRLSSVTIPNSVTHIGSAAFRDCISLAGVTFGNSVTNIQEEAFQSCTSLGSVMVPNSVTQIGYAAFRDCTNLASVTLPTGLTRIAGRAFYSCTRLASVTIPDSVTNIGILAFYSCTHMTNVTIGNGVTFIESDAFSRCYSLKGVYFQGNAPGVWGYPFYGDYLATVYHLPGTTGWEPFFTSLPTALWTPRIETRDSSFGVRTNRFGFNISWTGDLVTVVEATTNLANPAWFPIVTNTLTGGSSYFSDPEWTNHPARFYRLQAP